MKWRAFLLILFTGLSVPPARAQTPDSLALNESEAGLAQAYERIAENWYHQGQFLKAEQYAEKARAAYEQQGQTEAVSRATRLLAKAQEAQAKNEDAVRNFESASRSPVYEQNAMNQNDVRRLNSQNNSSLQEMSIRENIKISKNAGDQGELASSYSQLAHLNLQQNKFPEALQAFDSAVAEIGESRQVADIAEIISEKYAHEGRLDDAVAVHQKLYDRAVSSQNLPVQAVQLQRIAGIYLRKNMQDTALAYLLKSYRLALQSNRTLDAKKSLEKIVEIYSEKGDLRSCIELYGRFLSRMDSLLLSDPSIVDVKILMATEARIQQLEVEQNLKNELIGKTRRFNLALALALVVLSGMLLLIGRAWYAIRRKNQRIALQSLRREMNPHFLFNSLNSVNLYIAQGEPKEANKFLAAYAALVRISMERANMDFLPLSEELEFIGQYLRLEQMRFPEKLTFQVDIAEDLDPETLDIPNMLVQPHLENAIWHGLRYRDQPGFVRLNIEQSGKRVRVLIEDDGVGASKSEALKTTHQKMRVSTGLKNVRERIRLLNSIYGRNIQYDIREKQAPESGMIVEFSYDIIQRL